MKTFVILYCTIVLANGLYAMKQEQTIPTDKPNIIFILTDDQRADTVGFMGNEIVRTPNLDRLAADGHVFEQAFVTSAICTPSRACYMLGQYERKHGINFNSGTSMSPEAWAKSYPVLLRENGYFTGYVGKNHLPIGEKGYFTGLMEDSFDYWYAGHHHIGFYPKDKHEIFDNAKVDTQAEVMTESVLAFLDPESNEAFIDNAVQFLERRPDGQPFCLSIALNLPHGFSMERMEMRESDDELYKTAYRDQKDSLPLPPTYIAREDIKKPKLPADVLLTQLRQNGYNYVDKPEGVRERNVREYQAITGIDRMIGKLRQQLEDLGIADNTVIIITSDHGIFNGEHGLGGKSLCYETCLKVPFVMYDPRLADEQQGKRMRQLVLSVDVAPTILSLAGIEVPNTMQGSDINPLLRDDSQEWRQYAFGENLWSNIFGNPRCETVRSDEFRYIRYFKNDNLDLRARTPKDKFYQVSPEMRENYNASLTASIKGEAPVYEELYHISSDPYEVENLVNDPAYAKVLAEMRLQCQQLVTEAKGDVEAPPSTIVTDHKWHRTAYRNN
ncbi:sulfatase-like hydrolase/transferase [Rubellicoccus peritrichatus]|uniref:Sulfatase-like hydrolase/transferase n=1 Tax=Rubellicoccus peritrichatus TaxID=3080537 RepID=A0AAQ3L7K1_9BACT|nr:sulfatase-like hydrolase/transferase [Puniceicoccus sp. CR14]WOO39309.1 sulfatase-like hydrolase/transferase [Puniceicoccus sp. CR14]